MKLWNTVDSDWDETEGTNAFATDDELAAEAALARNADNLTSGTVADARIASTIARDSEVTAAISAHEAAADPHTGYLKEADASGTYAPLSAIDDTAYDATSWNGDTTHAPSKNAVRDKFASLAKGDVGLGNVDNTSDANKPVSTLQQTALDLKANLASPALTGNPTAPTATQGDNDTSIATTAFVNAEIAADAYTPGGTDVAVADGGTGASSAAAAATNLGLGTGDSPQFTAVNIGHASDTTLTRASAGNLAVEGNAIYRAGGTDVPVADGGTGASDASGARTNLGLVIGTDVQAYSAALAAWATRFTAASASGPGQFDLLEDTDNGSNKVTVKAADSLAADYVVTLPSATGTLVNTDQVFAQAQAVNAQTGTTYTLVAGDAGKLVTLSNASAITLTVPQDSDATIAVGTYVDLYQLGAGQVTVTAGTGATLRTSGLTAKARAQYSRLSVQKVSANTWSLMGDLAAS